LKELVEYGNKNILGNFELYLVIEEKREERYVKEATSGILDIKREEDKGVGKGRIAKEAPSNHNHNNNNNNNSQPWSTRPRDKFGRFMSSSSSSHSTNHSADFDKGYKLGG
jgi:hypothetical protein